MVGCKDEAVEATKSASETEEVAEKATEEDREEALAEEEVEQVEISLAMVYPEGHAQYPVIRKLVDEYKAENPNVTVNEEMLPSAEFQDKMLINYASGSVPNVFTVWPGAGNKVYAESNQWLKLDDYLAADADWNGGFNPGGVLDAFTFDGMDGTYGLPFGMYYVGFYYNKEIFEKAGVSAPATWADLLEVIDGLNAIGVQPISFGANDAWRSGHLFNSIFLKQEGIEGSKALASRERSYESDGVINSFEKLIELVDRNAFGGESYFGTGYAEEITDFFSEKTAIRFSGTWTIGELTGGADAPEGFADKVGYFAVPYFADKPEHKDIWFGGGVNDSIAVSGEGTKAEIEASILLAKKLTSSAAAKMFIEETGLIPAINPGSLDADKTGALLNELQGVIASAQGGADSGPVSHETVVPVANLLNELPQAVIGKGGVSPEQAAKDIQAEADAN